jgi:hypothetical protein
MWPKPKPITQNVHGIHTLWHRSQFAICNQPIDSLQSWSKEFQIGCSNYMGSFFNWNLGCQLLVAKIASIFKQVHQKQYNGLLVITL